MKTHTTNYFNTFIQVAEDCPATRGELPPDKGEKQSIAGMQFEILFEKPYQYTSDEVLFAVHARKQEIPAQELPQERELFFASGKACFRASPLTRRYGWGVHSDAAGKIAIFGCETEAYRELAANTELKQVKAMRSKRK